MYRIISEEGSERERERERCARCSAMFRAVKSRCSRWVSSTRICENSRDPTGLLLVAASCAGANRRIHASIVNSDYVSVFVTTATMSETLRGNRASSTTRERLASASPRKPARRLYNRLATCPIRRILYTDRRNCERESPDFHL